jgi:hypothetical protein
LPALVYYSSTEPGTGRGLRTFSRASSLLPLLEGRRVMPCHFPCQGLNSAMDRKLNAQRQSHPFIPRADPELAGQGTRSSGSRPSLLASGPPACRISQKTGRDRERTSWAGRTSCAAPGRTESAVADLPAVKVGGIAVSGIAAGGVALRALATGALATGAAAIGALAIGALAVVVSESATPLQRS